MEIRIEFIVRDGEDLENFHQQSTNPGWKVSYEDRYADALSWDEMIGLVGAITMPQPRPTLQWLLTHNEHIAREKLLFNTNTDDNG